MKHILFLLMAFVISNIWVKIQYDNVNAYINHSLRYVSDNIYRFGIAQFNAKNIDSKHVNKDVVIFDKNMDKVKNIDKSLNVLFEELKNNKSVKDSLWAIASVYPEYMYIKPWRDEYKNIGTKFKNGYFNYIVGIEDLNYLVQPDLNIFDTIKIYGPYIEIGTNNHLYSIYFPLYLDRELKSIVIIDLKSNFMERFIFDYNKNNFTYFQIDESDLNNILFNIIAMTNVEGRYKSIIKKPFTFLISLTFIIYSSFVSLGFVINIAINYINYINKDALTGFYNRKKYISMKKELQVNALLVIDIDDFKKINDLYGHHIGDNVIKEVCSRIGRTIRSTDIAIRWGGEEFVIIFYELKRIIDLEMKLDEIIYIVNSELIDDIAVTVSIGAIISKKSIPLMKAFRHADSALYSSKRTGKNKYTICNVDL